MTKSQAQQAAAKAYESAKLSLFIWSAFFTIPPKCPKIKAKLNEVFTPALQDALYSVKGMPKNGTFKGARAIIRVKGDPVYPNVEITDPIVVLPWQQCN